MLDKIHFQWHNQTGLATIDKMILCFVVVVFLPVEMLQHQLTVLHSVPLVMSGWPVSKTLQSVENHWVVTSSSTRCCHTSQGKLSGNITKTCPCNIHIFFSAVTIQKFHWKKKLIFLLKTFTVGTH